MHITAQEAIEIWPEGSREAAELVIEAYGEPDEVTPTTLTWREAGSWKRIVATATAFEHRFPAPHEDSVESVIDYAVPVERFADLAAFDGSVVAERTAGELSARCHDEQANALALNLAHDIVTGAKDVAAARDYYAKEFLDARRGNPTPYMDGLRFASDTATPDPDQRVLTDDDLERAVAEGHRRERTAS